MFLSNVIVRSTLGLPEWFYKKYILVKKFQTSEKNTIIEFMKLKNNNHSGYIFFLTNFGHFTTEPNIFISFLLRVFVMNVSIA